MIAKLKELRKNEEGFTLIELMVVVLIIGILAAIAIPVFLNLQKEGIKAGVKSDVKNTVTNVATFLASKPSATAAEVTTKFATAGPEGKVVTGTNAVAVTGVDVASGLDTYTVRGSHADTGTFAYTFNSATGQYVTTP